MAGIIEKNGRFEIRFQLGRNNRKSFYPGKISGKTPESRRKRVEKIREYLTDLAHRYRYGGKLEPSTEKWVAGCDDEQHHKLAKLGLVEPRRDRSGKECRELGPFCDAYIKSRTDLKPGTLDNYKHARRLLVEKFTAGRLLASITPADARRWTRWLASDKDHAEATISKHVKRAKTIFNEAVNDRLIESSPFTDVRSGSEVNRDRDHFVDRSAATTVLKGCPNHNWRLIVALARFGGLRRCEVLTIGWSDILWDVEKMRIDSPKTGLRFCPIFPELRPFLDVSFSEADEYAIRCVSDYHRDSNLGTRLNRIVESAGVIPWPKTFQNMRATRRTELQERYQDHVVNTWLGHSSKTAEKHYLQVTDSHWSDGCGELTGDPIDLESDTESVPQKSPHASTVNAPQSPATTRGDSSKSPRIPVDVVQGSLSPVTSATPQGLEP